MYLIDIFDLFSWFNIYIKMKYNNDISKYYIYIFIFDFSNLIIVKKYIYLYNKMLFLVKFSICWYDVVEGSDMLYILGLYD